MGNILVHLGVLKCDAMERFQMLGLGLGLGAMEPHSTADMPSMDQAHVTATLDAQGMPQAEHMMHRARGKGLSM